MIRTTATSTDSSVIEPRRLVVRRQREDGRHEQPDEGQDEQRGVRDGDLGAEVLGAVRRPPIRTLSAQDQQQVADDRAGQRRLDDLDQAGLEGEERDDQLGDVAERRVEDAADLRPGERAEPLGRQADDPGEPEDRRRRHDEQERLVGVQAEVEDDRQRGSGRPSRSGDARDSGESWPRIGRPERAWCGRGAAVMRAILAEAVSSAVEPRGAASPVAAATRRAASPRATPACDQRLDLGARRGEGARPRRRGRDRNAGRPRPRRPATNSPRGGIRPSGPAAAASSPSEPRTIVSWSLVSSRQTAPGRSRPHASARSRRVAATRPGASNSDRPALVGGDPGEPLAALAPGPRQEALERPARPGHARTPRPRPGRPMRPGSARPCRPRRPMPPPARRPDR